MQSVAYSPERERERDRDRDAVDVVSVLDTQVKLMKI